MKLRYYPMYYFMIVSFIAVFVATFFLPNKLAELIMIGGAVMAAIGCASCIGYGHGYRDGRFKLTREIK